MAAKSGGPRAPVGLQARGRRMWTESLTTWSLTPAHLVLLEEACRVADRCELLDRLIRKALKTPRRPVDDSGADSDGSGGITGLMAESRAQQTVLKGLLLELRQGTRLSAASADPAVPDTSGTTAGGSGVSDLSARIAARRNRPQS